MRLSRFQAANVRQRLPLHPRTRQPTTRLLQLGPGHGRELTTLAIETSCDDTAVAILERDDKTGEHTLLFNERISSDHRRFRGIEPLVAVQGHTTSLAPLVRKAVGHLPGGPASTGAAAATTARAQRKGVPDFVSVTRGPGIMPNLSVGLSTAKGLAVAWGVPLVGVHHMQAHALTPRLARALGWRMPVDDGRSGGPGGEESLARRQGERGEDRERGPDFPFLSLLVSGGHTQLVHSRSLTDHAILATTADVALGNLLDHSARDILPASVLDSAPDVMYGRVLEDFAFPDGGTRAEYESAFAPGRSRGAEVADAPARSETGGYGWTLPLPLRQTRRMAYSFASIGTTVRRIAESRRAADQDMDVDERRELARQTMAVAFRHLVDRLCIALDGDGHHHHHHHHHSSAGAGGVRTVVLAGGVACNRFLMHVLRATLDARGHRDMRVVVPPPALCTDNAAMIAWAGMEMYRAGHHTDLDVLAINRWPMDPAQGPGILGVPGWLRRPGF
ncbi:N6-L-threonylcarbamoyladenine synthase [Geosmithia morbida]|uniref:N(6)-L-threonylcarbamoyladenine synthase n=1 Tax=Geosmithia morbida TaxID=1094350 RepID=A0A9P4YXB3_9HYPO|nr:N6-L-threonylcarbamoyladenine synthase [Geosmithia morbida]KAF4123504.1 N6-L-threonylcarbamoyladenine synthase [Geosmithia morbida]